MTRLVVIVLVFAACGGGGSSGGLGDPDPRCTALCASTDASCSTATADCEPLCQVRVASMAPLCATCLLDSAGTRCSSGATCCPDPSYPNGVTDCATECAGSAGVNPSGDHPICADICKSDEPSCSSEVTSCLSQCDARVAGVSGLCALCLLDNANGGSCASGMVCCPNPHFPATTASCASVCNPS